MKTRFLVTFYLLVSSFCLTANAGRVVFPGYDWQVMDWNNRCNTNVGTLLPSTRLAATQFMRDVRNPGLYPGKIKRLNLICGNYTGATTDFGLGSVQVPIVIDKGTSADKNTLNRNWTYAEQGIGGGIKSGVGTNSFLDTGLVPSTDITSLNDMHTAVYVTSGNNEVGMSMGVTTPADNLHSIYQMPGWVDAHYYCALANETQYAQAACNINAGFFLGSRTGATTLNSYTNGVAFTSNGGASGSLPTASIFILARHAVSPSSDNQSTKTLGGYSIGTGLTAAETLAYYTAWQRFETALGRQQ